MGEAQPESESERSWGDGLKIFNDLLLLARRKNTGSSEAEMWVQHLDGGCDTVPCRKQTGGTRDELAQYSTVWCVLHSATLGKN